MWICCLKNNGRGGHRSSGLSGEIGPGIALVDLVRLPRRRHVLRPLPAVMIGVSITHLSYFSKKKIYYIEGLNFVLTVLKFFNLSFNFNRAQHIP